MHLSLDLILLLTVGINGLLLVFVVIKHPKTVRTRELAAFSASVLFLMLWATFNYLADTSTVQTEALLWTRLTFPAALFGTWSMLWFAFVFPQTTVPYKTYTIVTLILVLLFSIISVQPSVIASVVVSEFGISHVTLGSLYAPVLLLFLALLFSIARVLYIKNKTLDGNQKSQIRYVIGGWIIFFIGASMTNLILPYLTGGTEWSRFGPLFSVFMFSSVSYAIIQHHFFDIRIVVQKSLIYTILLIGIIFFYLFLITALGLFFGKNTQMTLLISAGITTLLGIFGVPIIEKYFQKWTDKIFFKDIFDFSEATHTLSQILCDNTTIDLIVTETQMTLSTILRTSNVTLYICERDEEVKDILAITQKDSADKKNYYSGHVLPLNDIRTEITGKQSIQKLLFLEKIKKVGDEINAIIATPIFSDHVLVGILFIGPKLSGGPFTHNDIKLLQSFSYQLGTALKKALLFDQVKDHSLHLEEKVRARTAEISELHNTQNQMMLDIAHGLQDPLTQIKSELDQMKQHAVQDKKMTLFEHSVDNLSQFIYDLLHLAQIEKQEIIHEKETIIVSEVLGELVEYFEVVADSKNVQLTAFIEKNVVVLGNLDQIKELITNIVSNALKYMPEASVKENMLSISLHTEFDMLQIVISDTGIGIDKNEVAYIFDRFYRCRSLSDTYPGAGLGLAIAKKITENHSGSISVESILDHGSTFTIEMPLLRKNFTDDTENFF